MFKTNVIFHFDFHMQLFLHGSSDWYLITCAVFHGVFFLLFLPNSTLRRIAYPMLCLWIVSTAGFINLILVQSPWNKTKNSILTLLMLPLTYFYDFYDLRRLSEVFFHISGKLSPLCKMQCLIRERSHEMVLQITVLCGQKECRIMYLFRKKY